MWNRNKTTVDTQPKSFHSFVPLFCLESARNVSGPQSSIQIKSKENKRRS